MRENIVQRLRAQYAEHKAEERFNSALLVQEAADEIERLTAARAQGEADSKDGTILVRLRRPEGYEGVHPLIVMEDAVDVAFEPELVPLPEAEKQAGGEVRDV
jgi:hypothetical protein